MWSHVQCGVSVEATISNTELVVFRKASAEETRARAQFWQRILRDEGSASGNHVKKASGTIEVECARATGEPYYSGEGSPCLV